MAKTPAKNDRRAVIDDIRRKQKGAERTRGYAIVAVCAVIAIAIIVAAGWKPLTSAIRTSHANSQALADIGKSPAAAGCAPYVTLKADGNQQHIPTGQQQIYSTAPPAFGPHWNEAGVAPVAMARKFYDSSDRPELEALVHNLEHGYTIVWYDDTIAKNEAQLDLVRSLGDHFTGTDDWRYKFIAVPWTAADEKETYKAGDPMTAFPPGKHIAFTHWSAGGLPVPVNAQGQADTSKQQGVFEYCSSVSGSALKQFMEAYPFTDSPEPAAM